VYSYMDDVSLGFQWLGRTISNLGSGNDFTRVRAEVHKG